MNPNTPPNVPDPTSEELSAASQAPQIQGGEVPTTAQARELPSYPPGFQPMGSSPVSDVFGPLSAQRARIHQQPQAQPQPAQGFTGHPAASHVVQGLIEYLSNPNPQLLARGDGSPRSLGHHVGAYMAHLMDGGQHVLAGAPAPGAPQQAPATAPQTPQMPQLACPELLNALPGAPPAAQPLLLKLAQTGQLSPAEQQYLHQQLQMPAAAPRPVR